MFDAGLPKLAPDAVKRTRTFAPSHLPIRRGRRLGRAKASPDACLTERGCGMFRARGNMNADSALPAIGASASRECGRHGDGGSAAAVSGVTRSAPCPRWPHLRVARPGCSDRRLTRVRSLAQDLRTCGKRRCGFFGFPCPASCRPMPGTAQRVRGLDSGARCLRGSSVAAPHHAGSCCGSHARGRGAPEGQRDAAWRR